LAGAFAPATAWLHSASELTLAVLPVAELPLGFLFRDPVRFLDLAGELIALACNHVELVVGEGDPAGETHTFALYYVPSADAMAWAEQGAVQLHPIYGDRAIGAMRALVAGISPFPRPRVTSVRVGNRRLAGPAAQSYLQLFSENGESPLGESPDDWIRLDLQSPKASPWTDGRPDLMYSPSANLIERGWQRFQLPDELAADLEAARALEASPSSGASRAWALGLGLLGVAAVGGLARVVRRGARTRER